MFPIAFATDPPTLITALLAAAVPTALYSLVLWWLDRYEKEPLRLILIAFFWGAIPAIVLAVLCEIVLSVPIERSPLGPNAGLWSLAPIVEEFFKAMALAGLLIWARNEIDGALDGIVYGALIGFGFSMTENALYFLYYGDVGALFWIRSVFFGLNHAFFTSVVGLAIGAVRYKHEPITQTAAMIGGLALAILFHAIHNYLSITFQLTGLFFSWLVQSMGVVVVLTVAMLAWRNERRWMEDELGDEVRAGVISAEDYANVTSSVGRTRHQTQALMKGGITHYLHVRRLHHLITELAFCKSKVRLADQTQDCNETEQLRRQIIDLRALLEQDSVALGEY